MVLDALRKVDVTTELLTIVAAKEGAENWDLSTTLNGEGDVLGTVGEVYVTC